MLSSISVQPQLSSLFSVGVSEVMATGLQGKVDVCIQGQRLNQTKEERAGVVYGADHRLSWTVAAPMPKIVVSQLSTNSMTSYSHSVIPITSTVPEEVRPAWCSSSN